MRFRNEDTIGGGMIAGVGYVPSVVDVTDPVTGERVDPVSCEFDVPDDVDAEGFVHQAKYVPVDAAAHQAVEDARGSGSDAAVPGSGDSDPAPQTAQEPAQPQHDADPGDDQHEGDH